ncbi:MAG TPA: right-handed parallel beta-helix repeat-containing protein, partial [Tepidisphaeraceae bacterium]|nr:right-handed parallel beta-helix repeat-containing protein [Tepidisphaeraceae bacterium]
MGHPCHNLLIESNTFRRIGWHRFEMCWNAAGAKLYTTLNSVVRNNVFEQMLDTSGIYFDLDNANTRITGNIFRNIAAPRGAIFLEMITEPIEIDHNVFDRINTGMLVPGAATGGHAVRAQHTDGTHIHHNLMIDVEGAGVEIFNDRIERTALTRSVLGLGFRIEHNLLIHCKAQIQAFVVGNTIDQNVYANIDSTHPAFRLHQLRTLCDPQLWMTLTGQDRASAFLSATRTANGFELALVPTWVSELCVPGMRVVRLESGILLERQS